MPCPKCGNTRLFSYERIVCPGCDDIRTLDTASQISAREIALQKAKEDFNKMMLYVDSHEVFAAALERRELVAEKIIRDPWTYGKEILVWCALSYLLCNRLPASKQFKKHKDFDSLLKLSVEITKLENEIDKLRKNQAKVAQITDRPEFCLSENFPLSFIPRAVENEIKKVVGASSGAFDQWRQEVKRENVETILTQALAMYPAIEVIKSEIINRQLKLAYSPRLFPSLTSRTAKKFVEISEELAKDLLYLRLEKIDRNGVVRLKKRHVYFLNHLRNAFSQTDIDWYLNLMSRYIPHNPAEDVYWLPFFTIKLLQLAVFKWSGLPRIGKGLDYVGKTVEKLIFNLLQSFEGKTTNPLTDEPLLDVVNSDTGEEIADVMMYNDNHIIIIESKFWDCPLLSTLESEIEKFDEKINLFKENQARWGFPPKAKVVPVFYTPFAPFATWNGIQLVSSRFLLSMYLFKFFNPKKPTLVIEDDLLRRLVLSEDYPIPYPVDAHDLDHRISANTRRIQDGLLVSYSECEVDVEIQNPLGHSFVITFEINKDTLKELKKQEIAPGPLIRMGIVNLSGSWSISQMLYFHKIDVNDPKRKIREIWGNTNVAEEIIRVFQKHSLDIFKFIEFCKARAPVKDYWPYVLAARMGTVLFLDENCDFVGQCLCGQIMGFPKELLEERRKMGFGRVLCRSCLKALGII